MTDTVQVPREATEKMRRMGARAFVGLERYARDYEYVDAQLSPEFAQVWRDMLAAAPQATDPRDVATVLAREAATTKRYDDKLAAAQAESEKLREALTEARSAILGLINSPWSQAEGSEDDWVGYIDRALSPLSPEKE